MTNFHGTQYEYDNVWEHHIMINFKSTNVMAVHTCMYVFVYGKSRFVPVLKLLSTKPWRTMG
jgi:hypothetical protein